MIPALSNANWESREAALMGTRVEVGVVHPDAATRGRAIDTALAEIARIEAVMSTYKADSEISAVNRDAAKQWVVVGTELFTLIALAVDFSELSDGAFDITYDSLGQHYDFRERIAPDEETRLAAAAAIDYRQIQLDPERRAVRFGRAGVRINLGGIAKGYAVERAIGALANLGIESALVSAGGDTRLLGARGEEPWIVGIRNPRDERDVAVRLPLVDEAISTSGDYERYFEREGTRYHHIFSPREGAPAAGVRSASVIGPDGLWTDALSTTVFVLGVEKGLQLLESLPEYEGIVVDSKQKLHFSSGFSAGASPVGN